MTLIVKGRHIVDVSAVDVKANGIDVEVGDVVRGKKMTEQVVQFFAFVIGNSLTIRAVDMVVLAVNIGVVAHHVFVVLYPHDQSMCHQRIKNLIDRASSDGGEGWFDVLENLVGGGVVVQGMNGIKHAKTLVCYL